MRYIHKFVNGFHCSFDSVNYENTQTFSLKREAEVAIAKMNQQVKSKEGK